MDAVADASHKAVIKCNFMVILVLVRKHKMGGVI